MEPAAEAYEPLSSRSRWAERGLIAAVAIYAVSAISAYVSYRVYQQDVVTQSDLDSADSRDSLVALLAFVVLIGAAIFFIRWFHRAYRNLRPLEGSEPRFKTWWAIGGWFIPIWNLFRPKQIANDLWRSSRSADEPANHVPALFQWWWAFFIISTLIENASFRADVSTSDVDTYSTLAVVDMFTDLLNVVAGILAILVVRRTTARMDARAARTASA